MRARPRAVEAIISGATVVHRLAIAWVNRNRKEYFTELCTSQKAWARDVLDAKPQGGAHEALTSGVSPPVRRGQRHHPHG